MSYGGLKVWGYGGLEREVEGRERFVCCECGKEEEESCFGEKEARSRSCLLAHEPCAWFWFLLALFGC